ncbi:MAG: hypothetical protein C0454_13400 [Parvibaculum sp.]|nr:hypothetical protein [Parvibaculum sp.]
MRKLPVFRSAGEVFSGVTRHFFELVRVAAAPLLLMVALAVAGIFIFMQSALGEWYMQILRMIAEPEQVPGPPPFTFVTFVGILIYFLIYLGLFAAAAVRWHRFVLFGEKPGAGTPSLGGGLDLGYFMVILKLFFAVIFAAIPVWGAMAVVAGFGVRAPGAVTLFGGIAIFVLFILLVMLIARISLALPDSAVGGGGSLGAMFDRSKGNGWRLIGYHLLIALGLTLVSFIYSMVLGLLPLEPTQGNIPVFLIVLVLLNIPLQLFTSMIGVTSLSVAYREIVGLPGGHEGEATVAEPTPGL